MNRMQIVVLIVLCISLAGHYVSQKMLLARGWKAENADPYIRRLMMNGGVLFITGIAALMVADKPFGLFGILLFIEGAVCVAFGRKLSRK